MKLLNQSLKYLSVALLIVIGVWAVIFYINMLDEVYDSIDDGLENNKLLIIERAKEDSLLLHKTAFNESNYSIQSISKQEALLARDIYKDTLMYMENEQDLEPVRILSSAFESNGKFYELKVISSMVEEDDLIEDLFWALVWLYVCLLVTIIIINNLLLQRIWKPFYKILDQLKTFRVGKSEVFQPVDTNVTEFKELNTAATELISHATETYNNQKSFTENAAHELQTPLAISINKLELLAEKNDLTESQTDTIGQVIGILERLTRLNKSLLLLSKIENKQFLSDRRIPINLITKQITEDFQDFAAYKELKIVLNEEANLEVEINSDLANILITNLIKNAIIHNVPNGIVQINITQGSISICNTSQSPQLDPHKIFNRFHKEVSDRNSTGLGLAIVKAITNLYGYTISYSYKDNQHCMLVNFEAS